MRALVSRNVTTECRGILYIFLFIFKWRRGKWGGGGGRSGGTETDRQRERETETGIFLDGRTDVRSERMRVVCSRVFISLHTASHLQEPAYSHWGGGDTYVNEITTKLHILGVVPLRSSPKRARVLYCPIKISVLFYLSCVLVFFNHAVNQLFKKKKKIVINNDEEYDGISGQYSTKDGALCIAPSVQTSPVH